jgi:hypothetical protein
MVKELDWGELLAELTAWLDQEVLVTVTSREPSRLVAQFRGRVSEVQDLTPAPGEPLLVLTADDFDGFFITEGDFARAVLTDGQLRIISRSVTLLIGLSGSVS